ncbi:hypothetical protein BN903_313 [Halorubrum sp. AJ67]|nr:hypothetical protein BN903_313 [Halorubrum sp. AJ67]
MSGSSSDPESARVLFLSDRTPPLTPTGGLGGFIRSHEHPVS